MKVKQTLLDSIKIIVESNGTVEIPYKIELDDWLDNIKIRKSHIYNKITVINPNSNTEKFEDINEAIEFFAKETFNRKNIGLAISGIRRYNLTDKDLDDLSDEKLQELIDLYNNKYLEKDYFE